MGLGVLAPEPPSKIYPPGGTLRSVRMALDCLALCCGAALRALLLSGIAVHRAAVDVEWTRSRDAPPGSDTQRAEPAAPSL
jgi:hypothetical protein